MLLSLLRLFIVKILELPEEYHISHCMLRYFQNGNRISLLHLYCIFNIASYRIIEGIDRPLHPIILMVDLKNLMADLVQTHYFFILTWLISYKASILTIHYGAIYWRFLFKVFPLIQRSEPRWAWFGEFSGGLPVWAGAAHSDLPGGDRQPGTGWGQQISLVLDTLNGFVH